MNSKFETKPQKFVRDIVWVTISQILISLTGLVILSTLTKSHSSEVYGIWVQLVVTVGLLSPVINLQFGSAFIRFLAGEEDKERRRCTIGTMLWPVLIFVCIVLVISAILKQELSVFLFADPSYTQVAFLTFVWASLKALFLLALCYLRARGQFKRVAIIQLALAVVEMALIVALSITGHSLGLIIIWVVVSETLFVVGTFMMIVRDIGLPKLGLGRLRDYLSFSIPQIPSVILFWVINSSDRYFITHFLNLSQTGIYSASYLLGNVIYLLFWPIGFVLYPTVVKFWSQQELSKVRNYFEYSTKLYITLALPAVAGLYLLSQPVLRIITTSEFEVGGTLVLLIALGVLFFGIFTLNVYVIHLVQKTKWFPFIFTISAFSNAAINVVLIPKIGIMAAAVSTIVSFFMLAVIVTVWARKEIGYKLDFQFLSKVILATTFMACCLWFIEINSALGIILVAIAGVLIYGLGLFLLRTFSKEDRRLITEIISGLKPRLKSD